MTTMLQRALLALFAIIFIWSAVRPHDYFTWCLEVFPAVIGLVLLIATRRTFPLTPLLYTLLFLHATILAVGGHYTYAEVPLGNWVRDALGLARNHYDRLGHLAQGFIPAMLAREILVRRNVVRGRGWVYFIVVSICLAISAAYELLEWRVSIATGSKGDAFLGTQGDIWDTQEDMATALVGALIAPLILGRLHDRQLARLAARENR
jgi:putative membrane protein